jgi:DNA topoisomerase IA
MRHPEAMAREYAERVRDQYVCLTDGTISAQELPEIVELITIEFMTKHTENLLEILSDNEEEGGTDVLHDSDNGGDSSGDE